MWIVALLASEMGVSSCEEVSSVPSSCEVASKLLSVKDTSGSGESAVPCQSNHLSLMLLLNFALVLCNFSVCV